MIATPNAMAPAVSVRSGIADQYGVHSSVPKLPTRADPIQISTAV